MLFNQSFIAKLHSQRNLARKTYINDEKYHIFRFQIKVKKKLEVYIDALDTEHMIHRNNISNGKKQHLKGDKD